MNEALATLERDFSALYSPIGRPSVAPEKLLRATLLQAFYSIRSERQLMERLEYDLLFRWFAGIGVDEAAWDHSSFSTNRDRLLEGDIAAKLLRQYFPKGTDLTIHSADQIAAVAAALNARPRRTLEWKTPAEALDQLLQSADTQPIARTA